MPRFSFVPIVRFTGCDPCAGRLCLRAFNQLIGCHCCWHLAGDYIENAPNLVLVPTEGFNLKAKVNAQTLAGEGIFTGKHTYDGAFLLVKGRDCRSIIPAQPVVSDVRSIVEKSEC